MFAWVIGCASCVYIPMSIFCLASCVKYFDIPIYHVRVKKSSRPTG